MLSIKSCLTGHIPYHTYSKCHFGGHVILMSPSCYEHNNWVGINNLLYHPYTKIEFIIPELGVSRHTAPKYLEALCDDGLLKNQIIIRSCYNINNALYGILTKDN